jgi:hypothetical protein
MAAARALPWLCIVLTVAAFGWLADGLGRGLELTDESYYVLGAVHADSVHLFSTAAHWVGAVLWKASGTLVSFRALGLALAVASAIALAWGVMRVAPLAGIEPPASASARTGVMATAASGALLYGSLLNFTPSYNLLAASGACLAMAFALMSMASGSHRRAFEVLAGFMLGVTLLCKFSAGVCTAGLLLALHAAFVQGRQPGLAKGPWRMLVACIAAVLCAALLETGIAEALRQFRAGLAVLWFAPQGDSSTWARVTRSAADVGALLAGTGLAFAGPLACFAASLRWRPLLWGCLGIAWFAALLAANRDLVSGGSSHYAVQALAPTALLAFALMGAPQHWAGSFKAVSFVLALVALPFAVAIGTSNPLQIQILTVMAPWGVLVGLFGFSNSRARFPVAASAVLFTAVALLQVVSNGAEPYRMRPLPGQTQPVVLGQMGSVKVDPATAALVHDMQGAARACGVGAGTPFLDFYDLPGIALMIDAVPVETPWLFSQAYATLALKGADPAVLRRAVIAVRLGHAGQRPSPPGQLPAFPQGFRLCGRSVAPFDGSRLELWAPSGP